MVKSTKNNHQTIVDLIYKRLSDSHKDSLVLKNLEYKLKSNKFGECDVMLIHSSENKKYAYAIEVKSHYSDKSKRKAYKQLAKDNLYIKETFGIERIFDFYAYGHSDGKYTVNLIKKEKIKEKEKRFI